jgi:hypothetical protein
MSGLVTSAIEIDARPDVVFDYMTDLRNEPRWNPEMRRVEKITDGHIGAGTRFPTVFGRRRRRGIRGAHLLRPSPVLVLAQSVPIARRRVREPRGGRPGGSRLVIRTTLYPHGVLRAASPLLRHWIQRTWARDLGTVKAQVEQAAQEET